MSNPSHPRIADLIKRLTISPNLLIIMYETNVFIGQMDTVSDSRGNSWDNTRVDGSTVVIELVVSNESRKVINSQLSIN